MTNKLNQLLVYRKTILIVLIVILFINWYFYRPLYEQLKLLDNYPFIADILVPLIGYKATQFIIVKGFVFFTLASFNSLLSLTIIFFYFHGSLLITKASARILFLFCLITICLELLFFITNNDFLFLKIRYAMQILPSPLVEATLIPLMKLYQQSLNQKD